MKKDLDKILSRTLLTYTFILFFIFILKIAGFDYFGLDINNPVIVAIDKFATKFHLANVWYCVTLYLYSYENIAICCKDNSKRAKVYALITLPFAINFLKSLQKDSFLSLNSAFFAFLIAFFSSFVSFSFFNFII